MSIRIRRSPHVNFSSSIWMVDKYRDGRLMIHDRKHNMPQEIVKTDRTLKIYFIEEKGVHLYIPSEINTLCVIAFIKIKLEKKYGLVSIKAELKRINEYGDDIS